MNWTLILGVFVALSAAFYAATFALLHWMNDDGAVAAAREVYDVAGPRAVVLIPYAVWLTVLLVLAAPTPANPDLSRGEHE